VLGRLSYRCEMKRSLGGNLFGLNRLVYLGEQGAVGSKNWHTADGLPTVHSRGRFVSLLLKFFAL
jgi:hypothetical protein